MYCGHSKHQRHLLALLQTAMDAAETSLHDFIIGHSFFKYRTEQKATRAPHILLSETPPPCSVFICEACLTQEDKLIWVACFLLNQIPNTVDHRYYSLYIPLLALIYTNTHLPGQGRLGENYCSLIYETQGRSKVSRPRQA